MYLKQAFKGNNKFSMYFLGTIIILFLSQFIGVVPLIIATVIKGSDLKNLANVMDLNLLLILNIIPFILGCLALWLCVRKLHGKKFKDIVTIRSSFDFNRALTGGAIWGIILLLTLIPEIYNSNSTLEFNFQPDKLVWLIVICLLLLPFQTSFEEFLFRGYYMQATAVTSKNRWVPILVTSIIFGLMHAANPEVAAFGFWTAMPNYVMTGLILGIAAVMDDGLEIPLGMHFANNFLSAVFLSSKDSALQTPSLFIDTAPTMSYMDNIVTILSGFIFLFACSRIYKWTSFKKIFTKIKVELQKQEA